MKICDVMVGLPACGKSSTIKHLLKDETWVYSTDDYIENVAKSKGLTYSEVFSDYIGEATKYNNDTLEEVLKAGRHIIWDQTNLTLKKRRVIINRMRQNGYIVNCRCIVPPEPGHFDDLKVWKFRLNNRPGKTIPEHVITSMYNSYTEPTLDEGFDALYFYNIWGHQIPNYVEEGSVGSSFDDFLNEEGRLEDAESTALKRVNEFESKQGTKI